MEACIIVTYRCNAKCHMCNTWQYPSQPKEEITPAVVDKLPGGLNFINITGGEPFLREDLADIVQVALSKTKRLVISTNGYFTERMIALARRFPQIGVRISIEGLPPVLYEQPKHCPFAPRCKFVVERCWNENPELHPVGAGSDHYIACWLDVKTGRMRS